jgi:mannose-6-phosphate isomerase-like protein (cupin superfamily)
LNIMKVFILFIFLTISNFSFSQEVTNLKDIQPAKEFENILVKKLDTDSNSTAFVIWIKKVVKSHKHETHSEIISIIEGEGVMTINNKSFDIKSGDYFRIPKNTFHSLTVKSEEPMKVLSVQSPEFLGKDRVFEN